MDEAKPQAEHEWLHKLVGEWTSEMEAIMGPDQPPLKLKGTDSVRSLGGLWILCDGTGDMPGGIGYTLMTLGYDPAKKHFVGSFIGSMMTHMWVYEGTLNGNVLTLDTEGPNFTVPGTTAKYKDVITLVSDDHRTLTSSTPGPDGKWAQFMTVHYRRKK